MKIFTDFSKTFASKMPELDKKNKTVIISNLQNSEIQKRFRAIHPSILCVEIDDSSFYCPNHNSSTFRKDHVHNVGCSQCVSYHSHQNLCDRLKIIIDQNRLDIKDADWLKLAISPLMLEIFDFLPEMYQMYEEYDVDNIDSRLILAYRGSDYVYPGCR